MSLARHPRGHACPRLRNAFRWLLPLLLSALVHGNATGQGVLDEYRLKAAFVYRFPQFVEWPASALDGRATIDLCLFGPNPFGRVLHDLVQGESLAGRPLTVRHVAGTAVSGCQLLYLPEELSTRKAVLHHVSRVPILTVSDAPQFLDEGGIVQLRLIDSRVRFEIDAHAAQRAGLRLSAQLLRLALSVRGSER